MNPSAQPVRIYRRTRLGDFEQVDHAIVTSQLNDVGLSNASYSASSVDSASTPTLGALLKVVILTFLISQIVCCVTVTKIMYLLSQIIN